MLNPFRPLGNALRDMFDEFLIVIVCNVLWCLFSLPLFWVAYTLLGFGSPIIATIVALLAVLPAGPATAGLYYVMHRVFEARAIKVSDFFVGLRQFARQGWVVFGIWVIGLLFILFDLGFYSQSSGALAAIILGIWIYALLLWLAMMLYAFPLVFMQEQPDLRLVARNAALMTIGRPVFTLITLLLMLVITIFSVALILPFLLITVALLSLWSFRVTRTVVDDAQRRRNEAEGVNQPAPEEKGRKGQVRPK